MRVYIIIGIILSMGFRAAAQDKLLVAGSGNPNILLLDKQTGKVEWQHALEKGEECNAVALTKKGEIFKPVFEKISKDLNEMLYKNLSAEEADILEKLLRKII